MENLRFYFDYKNDMLFAHEESTEFFVLYVSNSWVSSKISFMQFRHDYEFTEISTSEAYSKTNGNLPTKEYQKFLDMIRSNIGE